MPPTNAAISEAKDEVAQIFLGQNVMDPEMKLRQTHDISETLQIKLERLPYVERAFVHCDYELDGDEHI
uniref:Cation efflux protein cytoplasmic domain-containing protein n=1 Tax=Parascaris equorum TaxID=6256 RepID=A0A914S5E5_PAREQ